MLVTLFTKLKIYVHSCFAHQTKNAVTLLTTLGAHTQSYRAYYIEDKQLPSSSN